MAYPIGEDETVRFAGGENDPSLPLVIDPPYDPAKVYKGTDSAAAIEAGHGIYVPSTGNVAVTGTNSSNIAPWSGVVSNKGASDAFFFEISNTGGAAKRR